jgi:hypothetical protein
MPSKMSRIAAYTPALLGVAALALLGSRLEGDAGRVSLWVATAAVLVAFGLTSWRLGRSEAGSEGVAWGPLLDRLDRIATALESRPLATAPEVSAAPVDLTPITLAIAEKRWQAAETLLAQQSDHPGHARLAADLGAAKQVVGEGLLAELKAAQEVNDPERVLAIHQDLAAVLPAAELAEHETGIVKWSLALIMRRLRTGTVRPDVSELASRVAERFPKSVEGASLRASLPTLRRSAGLCPRCAQPYRGIADACPLCLAGPAVENIVTDGNGDQTSPAPSIQTA